MLPAGLRGHARAAVVAGSLLGLAGALLARPAAAEARIPSSGPPVGRLAPITLRFAAAHLVGFAIDPDSTGPVRVRITRDGRTVKTVTADRYRASLARAYPFFGGRHGFDTTVPVPNGQHRVCAIARNVRAGHDTLLGCRSLTGQNDPAGRFATIRRADTGVQVTGWALDPNTSAAISVRATMDGTPAGTFPAATATTLPLAWTAYGARHGFTVTLPATPAAHSVCLTAVNVGLGRDRSLGCRTAVAVVDPPAAPQNLAVTAVATTTVALQWADPATPGGVAVTGYRVAVNGAVVATPPAGTTTFTVTGLTPGTGYAISVAAVNDGGAGTPASVQVTTTAVAIPPQTTPAPVSTSHYLRDLTGVASHDVPLLRSMGATDAGYNPSGHRYLVLQDIGAQSGNGVLLSATTRWVSYTALVSALEAYVDGYASKQKANAPMLLAIGTNNDGAVSSATGATWATKVVDPVRAYAIKYPTVTVAGANDIEPGFSATVTASRSWLTGYLGATTAGFVFNGSADGCPTSSGTRCNNGWTTADLRWLAGGAAPARTLALPQIYNTAMPKQWHLISALAAPRLAFAGPLTEWTACAQDNGSCYSATNVSAWTMLFNALNADPRTSVAELPYGTDLRIN